jgi:hypothetical protein
MKKQTETQTFDQVLESEKNPIENKPMGLHSAIVNVMKAVKNIDKAMTVGTGNSSYKGVADKDVKYIIGSAMAENNLTCLPIDIDQKIQIDRWTEETNYGPKAKQSVFTEVKARFLLTHSLTNESIEIVGYGHGIDSQDKSAGKATTYALKNALLYSFLVPTGHIDDTDKTHSDNIEVPNSSQPKALTLNEKQFISAVGAINAGKYTVQYFFDKYSLTPEQINVLNELNA